MAADIDSSLNTSLTDLIKPICDEHGFELVAVVFRRESHGQVLRIVIYHPDGISIDDCSAISRQVSYLLDVEDIIEQAYHLEVTSPGLNWPLKTEQDFNRYKGKQIKVTWQVDEQKTITNKGVIEEVKDSQVLLIIDKNIKEIPITQIKKAKLVIEF